MSRSFMRGVVLTLGTNLAILLVGVGTSVAAARLLGPADFGLYSLAQLFGVIVITFSNCGVPPATVYHVSRGVHATGAIVASNVLFGMAAGGVAAALAMGAAYAWGEHLLPHLPLSIALLAVLLVPVSHVFSTVRSVLHGQQRFAALSVATVAEAALRFALVVGALLLVEARVGAAVAANLAGAALAALALLLYLRRHGAGGGWRFSRAYLGDALRYGSKTFLGNSIQFLNYRLDMLVLNVWQGPAAVGFYTIAVLFAERLGMISGSASSVLFPRVASAGEGHSDTTAAVSRVVLWVGAAAALAFYLISKPLVLLLYSSRFEAAVQPLQVLLVGMAALGAADVVAHDFAGRGKPLVNTVIAAVTLVANLSLLLVLVPRHGMLGAAWASTASYLLQTVLTLGWFVRTSGQSPASLLVLRRQDVRRIRDMLPRAPWRARAA